MKAAHPDKANFIDTFESAKLGAELLHIWGLPERICKIVEFQQYPEFTAPDLIPPEHRRETGTLHIAHIIELLLTGQPVDPTRSIYTRDYMAVLGFANLTPEELLKDRVMPNILKHKSRIPPEIQSVFVKPGDNAKANR
jgi:hypothetical protein